MSANDVIAASINGPIKNPANPNKDNPPKTPNNTTTGCIPALSPISFGFNRLSALEIMNTPYNNKPTPCQTSVMFPDVVPFAIRYNAAGIQIIAVPTNGTNAKIAMIIPQIKNDSIPKIQKPNAPRAPCITAIKIEPYITACVVSLSLLYNIV